MKQPINKCTAGFSLLELLIVLALTGLVAAAGYTFYTSQYRTKIQQDRVTGMQQNLRSAMEIMARDIRMAGYDPTEEAGSGITTATATQLSFTYATDADTNGIDDDGDNVVDEADEGRLTASVTYTIGDGNKDGNPDILRNFNGGGNVVVSESMEALIQLHPPRRVHNRSPNNIGQHHRGSPGTPGTNPQGRSCLQQLRHLHGLCLQLGALRRRPQASPAP